MKLEGKLNLGAKVGRINALVAKQPQSGKTAIDWKRTKKAYQARMFKERGVAAQKYSKAQTEEKLRKLKDKTGKIPPKKPAPKAKAPQNAPPMLSLAERIKNRDRSLSFK